MRIDFDTLSVFMSTNQENPVGASMEFTVKAGHPEKQRSGLIVVGVFENKKQSQTAKELDTASQQALSSLIKKGDMEGKIGQSLLVHFLPGIAAERVLLMGCGKSETLTDKAFRDICTKAFLLIRDTGAEDALFSLTELSVENRDIPWKIRQIIEIVSHAFYKFEDYKSQKNGFTKTLRRVQFIVPNKKDVRPSELAIAQGLSISNGMELTKNLANTPPNICTPEFLAKAAEKLAKTFSSLSVAVLDEKQMRALKMNSLLSVAQGSKHAPKLITLEYRGRKDKQKPIVLVGKGVTFDTGGNSLKPPPNMIGMKYDMCGAATVLGTLQAAAELELPLNLVGVIPAVENMPGSTASRPEDIVTSMSGLTIEILNTDAEGRLILCDALTYVDRFNPDVVIDMATLTGACSLALGRVPSAVLTNYQPLADKLLEAGQKSGDRCWQLPLWEEYQEALVSPFADIANIGNVPDAGTILGAAFLSRFTTQYHWAHLDIANTSACFTGPTRGATGRPVPLLVQYLIDRVTD